MSTRVPLNIPEHFKEKADNNVFNFRKNNRNKQRDSVHRNQLTIAFNRCLKKMSYPQNQSDVNVKVSIEEDCFEHVCWVIPEWCDVINKVGVEQGFYVENDMDWFTYDKNTSNKELWFEYKIGNMCENNNHVVVLRST